MNSNPITFQKLPSRWNKKQANFENMEGGEVTKQKKRLLGKTSRKNTKNHLDIP
jgi:hypothetical protein